ncbi:MAG: response regulator [Candidatus Omnitrophota bacterium]
MDKILIIQDSPSVNAMFKFRLESAGFFVETAESGEEGIKKAKEAQYQLILLDYTLPCMDGAEVCRILKSQKHTKDIPVVFMSAKEEDEICKITEDAGANGYVCLPLEGKELVEKIESLIKSSKL